MVAVEILPKSQRRLLNAIVSYSVGTVAGVDALRFLADHEQELSDVDALIAQGLVSRQGDRLVLRLPALAGLAPINPEATRLWAEACDVFRDVRTKYLERPGAPIGLTEIAESAGVPRTTLSLALTVLTQAPIWSRHPGDFLDPSATVTPSETILRYDQLSDTLAWFEQQAPASELPWSTTTDDDESDFVLDPKQPLVLLLGWIEHEGITSALKAAGRQYKRKMLDSKPENWTAIAALFEQYEISCVLGKLSPQVCKLLSDTNYAQCRTPLFERIASVPSMFFAYEDIFIGRESDRFRAEYRPYPPKAALSDALDFIRTFSIELMPYRTSSEVTVLAQSFLDDAERNLIFRLYVPNGKLWADETDRFLGLFQHYLTNVEKLSVRLDQKRTDRGVIYEFHGQVAGGERSLAEEFGEFSNLMDLCGTDPEAASKRLALKLDAKKVIAIIERYAKEARRLRLDLRHELEHKLLGVRHRLESELDDLGPTAQDWAAISVMLEAIMPRIEGQTQVLSTTVGGQGSSIVGRSQNVTYNIRPQFIQAVDSVVASEINGNQHFAPQHHELLALIEKFSGKDKRALETASTLR